MKSISYDAMAWHENAYPVMGEATFTIPNLPDDLKTGSQQTISGYLKRLEEAGLARSCGKVRPDQLSRSTECGFVRCGKRGHVMQWRFLK